jgi:hypothetical protein
MQFVNVTVICIYMQLQGNNVSEFLFHRETMLDIFKCAKQDMSRIKSECQA